METLSSVDGLRSALATGKEAAANWFLSVPRREAVHALRTILLTDATLSPNLVPESIPPVWAELPVLDAPAASDTLLEELLLLRAAQGQQAQVALPDAEGNELRLGWAVSMERPARLLPRLAADLLAGKWSAGTPWWDRYVGEASSPGEAARRLLQSPARILALSSELLTNLPSIGRALERAAHATWRPPLALEVSEATRNAGEALRGDALLELVKRAAVPAAASERVEVQALHCAQLAGASNTQAVAEALLLVARGSPFFGADDDLWTVRLQGNITAETTQGVRWSADHREGVRWLEWLLTSGLAHSPDLFDPQPGVETWLRGVAARTLNVWERQFEAIAVEHPESSPLRARMLLARFRRLWLAKLPPEARDETLAFLAAKEIRLADLQWIMAGLPELEGNKTTNLADAWRLRRADSRDPELRAFLGTYAFASLSTSERAELLELASRAPTNWRVGVLVMLGREAHRANDERVPAQAGEQLLGLLGVGTLAIPAAIGLLQLIRSGALQPRGAWRTKVLDSLPDAVRSDGRVAREIELER
ncbi:MAG TPA: hypothetical protein VHC20_01625 [Candidatus Paceibacterota bacterium]|nr:hypothetical protein [Candidatus Paceibacterota bacterium]